MVGNYRYLIFCDFSWRALGGAKNSGHIHPDVCGQSLIDTAMSVFQIILYKFGQLSFISGLPGKLD